MLCSLKMMPPKYNTIVGIELIPQLAMKTENHNLSYFVKGYLSYSHNCISLKSFINSMGSLYVDKF